MKERRDEDKEGMDWEVHKSKCEKQCSRITPEDRQAKKEGKKI